MSEPKFNIFIPGETIDLCAPEKSPETMAQWANWFNNCDVTRYLAQGIFPNTVTLQEKFLESAEKSNDRLITLIKPKNEKKYIGVASLSFINYQQRQCDFAVVIGEKDNNPDAMFYGLETKALLIEHAFEKLGIERINSSQVMPLLKWQKYQALMGFQIEGIQRKKFKKGIECYDVIISSCLLDDYLKVKKLNKGNYWPGKKVFLNQMRAIPKNNIIMELENWLNKRREEYWNEIFKQ